MSAIPSTMLAETARNRSVSAFSSAARNSSSAVTRPTTSSFDVFAARPMAWFGLAFSVAARIRSRRPARMPVLWGPRMPLPPLKMTRSAPPRR